MSRENATDDKKTCQNSDNKWIVKQFCENTSIHGLKYIFEDGSIFFERYGDFLKIVKIIFVILFFNPLILQFYDVWRFIWLLVFLSGVSFYSYFCVQMWHKWVESPVLTSVETQLYPLNNIFFPAVTICNVNKVSRRKLQEAMEHPK